jgi:formylglycine-generating enzyme required for sulfatase activity
MPTQQFGGFCTTSSVPGVNSNWPNGFKAFYCMKYEITQGQYRDFLNTLTYLQQSTRTGVAPNSPVTSGAMGTNNASRNGIDIQTPGNPTTVIPAVYGCNLNNNSIFNEAFDGEWLACNSISYTDQAAFLDWAGLRPMTELEYEKACRGPLYTANEYAWGTTQLSAATAISNSGASNELITNPGLSWANINNVYTAGPMRVGIFAGSFTSRQQAGATYYGIMEMTGNLAESVINVTNTGFTGNHGDGLLSVSGNANATTWSGISSGEVTAPSASDRGGRGGSFSEAVVSIINRSFVVGGYGGRLPNFGGRGVRSAQ